MSTVKKWFTLKEASEITGRSLNSIRLLVHRKKISNIKKIKENGRSQWMIHRDELGALSSATAPSQSDDKCQRCTFISGEDPTICLEICGIDNPGGDICLTEEENEASEELILKSEMPPANFVMEGHFSDDGKGVYVASIPLDYYEKKQKEWEQERDRLLQGIILYKLRFEELEGKLKALPAPPEMLNGRITELEEQLTRENAARDRVFEELVKETGESRSAYEKQLQQQTAVIEELRAKNEKDEEEKEHLWEMLNEREKELWQIKKPWWQKWFGY